MQWVPTSYFLHNSDFHLSLFPPVVIISVVLFLAFMVIVAYINVASPFRWQVLFLMPLHELPV